MKRIFTLASLFFMTSFMMAQVRYVDPMFDVDVQSNIVYGNNFSVLQLPPVPIDLLMDVYTPVGDTETERPIVLVAHTGSFLPKFINGQTTGSTTDSTVVFTCTELARRGYVAVAYTHRLGWLPTSPDENVRRGTLLQAAYRGIQDTRTCVRFFRRDAAENGNQFSVDPERIGIFGIGTGGYLALGAGSLYDFEDVLLDKFIDTNTALPYINQAIDGDIFGTTDAAISNANHVGFSSDIALAFNVGGALGDESWIKGTDSESAFAGVHATGDAFAPYARGPVIVPTTNEFVVVVDGTRAAIEKANASGNNDVFDQLLDDEFTALIDAQIATDITLPTMQTLPTGTENFYGFVTPFPQGSPWDWWDKATLDVVVEATDQASGGAFMLNSDTLHINGLATNPNMSALQGRTYMDSIFSLFIPRSCAALELFCEGVTSVEEELVNYDIQMIPNPAVDNITFRSDAAMIRSIYVLDVKGQLVASVNNVDNDNYTLNRNSLPDGVYLAQLRFDDGNTTIKFMFE